MQFAPLSTRNNSRPFCSQGVTGSGKTEVYLECHRSGAGAGPRRADAGPRNRPDARRRRPVPPAFRRARGDSAFRVSRFRTRPGVAAHPLRRSSVVVATRSGVFAPVRNLGLIIVDEEHDQSYKQQETPRYHGRDVAVVRARDAKRGRRARLRHAQSRNPLQRRARQIHSPGAARAHRAPPHAARRADRHAPGVSRNPQAGDVLARARSTPSPSASTTASRPCCCSTAAAFRASSPAAPAASGWSAPTARSR